MTTFRLIEKTKEYIDYLHRHMSLVEKAWVEMKRKCKDMIFITDDYYYHTLNHEIQFHDYSKLSAEEFTQYRDYFFPVEEHRRNSEVFDKAWEHHKINNLHHWESIFNKDCFPIPWEVNVAHMIVDWMAMAYYYGDTAQEYYEKNRETIKLPDYVIDFIYEIFKRIK